MTNLIVTWQDIKRLELSPIYQIHGAFDDYPFPYDDAARVLIKAPIAKDIDGTFCIVVLPCGSRGMIISQSNPNGTRWERWEKGYELFPEREISDYATNVLNHLVHCAVTALRAVAAYHLPRVEAQKRDIKKATKGFQSIPETKTDKYYVLKLSGRSLDYLPEPERKCRATGIKQRWHMCRGHYRHLKSGKVVFVRGHYRGDKALGIVHKDYAL